MHLVSDLDVLPLLLKIQCTLNWVYNLFLKIIIETKVNYHMLKWSYSKVRYRRRPTKLLFVEFNGAKILSLYIKKHANINYITITGIIVT